MKTIAMMSAARNTNDSYMSNELCYNESRGFVDTLSGEPADFCDFPSTTFNEFFDFEWEKCVPMSRHEAERKFHIKIIG